MVQLKARKATSLIGVDFGTCSLRAVQLHLRADGWHVHHWVNLELEPTSCEPTAPHAAADLDLAFGPGTFTDRRMALTLSPPDVDYQLLDVPSAVLDQPADELRTALQIELDRHMPWPIAESQIAAWSVNPKATGKVPAMIVAARRAPLESRLRELGEHGFECERADIVPNAMIQLQQSARPAGAAAPQDILWGLLDLGFHSCRFYLIHADRPVYARVIHSGGCEFTKTLAKALHVEFATAEKYKRVYGIRPTERGFRPMLGGLTRITEDELPGVLYAILRPIIEEMVHEIERSYRFAMGRLPGVQAGPMVLIGGGARLQGLVDVLSSQLGVPARLPDPASVLSGGGTGKLEENPMFRPANYLVLAPCVGLALKGGAP